MFKLLFSLLLVSLTLQALTVNINSDNFKQISSKLSTEENIQKLITEQRVGYEQLVSHSTQNFDNNSQRAITQREYARLKMLLVYLSKDTQKTELKDKLRNAFFKQYASKKEEYSFVYKITYPNAQKLSGDDVLEFLQKKISLYILSQYGVSNIEDTSILTNLKMTTYTKNYTLGTTESNFLNNFDNSYHYSQDQTTRSGVISFIFYPFVMIKQNHNQVKNNFVASKGDVQTDFTEIKNKDGFSDIKFPLDAQDQIKIREFISTYTKTYAVDVSQSVNQISNKILKYNKFALTLFDTYPTCNDIACLDNTIKTKLNSYSTIKKSKLYVYDIDLSNDDDLEYVVLPAFRKLKKYLRRDTKMTSFEDTEVINGDAFSKNTMESKFVAIVKNVKVTPYIKGTEQLGLHFEVNISFEESDLCSQYLIGLTKETLYGTHFVKLKTLDETLEVSQTEITNRLFHKILPHAKREEQCQKTVGANKPINCLSYSTLDTFLVKLNKRSQTYKYRFLTCKEALFFATCGSKQKFCWGNRPDYKKYEFLRDGKYDLKSYAVAQKKPNHLKLYDFCGNTSEYCTDKRGWYKTFGSTQKHLEPRVSKNSYSDVSGMRLVRERK